MKGNGSTLGTTPPDLFIWMPKYFWRKKVDILLRRYPPQTIVVQGQEIVSHQIGHFLFSPSSYQLKTEITFNQPTHVYKIEITVGLWLEEDGGGKQSQKPSGCNFRQENHPLLLFSHTENLEASDCVEPEQKKHNKRPSTCLSAI